MSKMSKREEMQFSHKNNLFYLKCDITDNEFARRAGFAWDRENRTWVTPFASVAKKFRPVEDKTVWLNAVLSKQTEEAKTARLSHALYSNYHKPKNEKFGLTFLPFQLAGIEYMLGRDRTLLADPMGVGKTIQAIGYCNEIFANEKKTNILIVCPASLKTNWLNEWEIWSTLKQFSIGIVSGKKWANTDIVIINYDILAKHEKDIGIYWSLIILDECQYLKNPKALRTRRVLGYRGTKPLQARKVLALTGTPILNRPIEIYPILKYLTPFGFPNKMNFAKRYCDAKRTRFGFDMNGASNGEELQYLLRSTVMVRREKEEVLPFLPDKIKQIVQLDPEKGSITLLKKEKKFFEDFIPEWEKVSDSNYNDIMETLSPGHVSFEEMSEMRKELSILKTPLVIEHLQNAIDSSGKVVVFCHHKKMVSEIKKVFGNSAVVLTGSTTLPKKDKAVEMFQKLDRIKLFIGNIKAAGVGITLTASSHIVFAELDWVPGVMSQAEDRCHRIGQKNSLLVQYLVLNGSLDVLMAQRIIKKQKVISRALDTKLDPKLLEALK